MDVKVESWVGFIDYVEEGEVFGFEVGVFEIDVGFYFLFVVFEEVVDYE